VIGEYVVEARRSSHLQQLLGVADGQGFEHHRIDQAEDCVLAPMPRASERMATAAKPGLERRARRA